MVRNLFGIGMILNILFVGGLSTTQACMYGPPYRTVCETYADADAIIVGTIDEVERRDSYQLVSISIVKSYKGRLTRRVRLKQPLSTCDWDFDGEQSKRMLLYLVRDRRSNSFHAIAEGMGGDLAKTGEDQVWLNGLPRSRERTMLSGTIELYRDDPFQLLKYLGGIKVKVFNAVQAFETTTNPEGVYYLWDIPGGKYKIAPEIPLEYRLGLTLSKGFVEFKPIDDDQVDVNDFQVEIRPRKCGGSNYVFYPALNREN